MHKMRWTRTCPECGEPMVWVHEDDQYPKLECRACLEEPAFDFRDEPAMAEEDDLPW